MLKFAVMLFPALMFAQNAPRFEAASIKPDDALKNAGVTSGWSVSLSGNGLRTVGTLHSFIRYAWDVEDVQIAGGPSWLNGEMYEINARAAAQVSVADLKLMLQSLLAERFKLTLHPETRELSAYSLVLARGGSRLHQGDEADRGRLSSGATLLRGTMDSSAIAQHLTSILHRPVIDHTGLQGIWKFDLRWAADDVTTGPSLFTAIQEQLGLKLEATKAPVQVFVIDRAEKPSEN